MFNHSLVVEQPYELARATRKVCSILPAGWELRCATDPWGFCAPVATKEGLGCVPRVSSWPGSRARGWLLFHS